MCFNYVSKGAVGGGCWFNEILGEEEIEKWDEISDTTDNRFIWRREVWFAFTGLVYWEVIHIII